MANLLDMLDRAHGHAKAMYDQTDASMRHLEAIQAALRGLSEKADLVTPDDVIKASGKLVGSGNFSAPEMASILSDMPATGGQGLASWIAMHLDKVSQTLAKLTPIHNVVKHEMGVSAMRALGAHVAAGQQGAPPTGPSAPLQPGAMTLNEETPTSGAA